MASQKVNLDAMIPRADFAVVRGESSSSDKIGSLGVEQLSSSSLVIKNMRKPDFQRETTHWTPVQLVTFLKSYVDRELIPSVILWQSPSFIFVIDGAHRLSALRAWIEDDYGDGPISQQFFNHEVSKAQKKVANRVRSLINKEIGKYSMIRAAVGQTEGFEPLLRARASSTVSRSFSLQWVEGDAEKAETSFFKINTQGTPLHKTEERLLRLRLKPLAITARSIVRAGTGNKYWSHFENEQRESIESLSRELHEFIFQPEINEPIKTLDLPLGGASSPIDALNLLMDFIEATAGTLPDGELNELLYKNDLDGTNSINTLRTCLRVMTRITGNGPGSLGLHPAVYFYGNRGKHSQHLFLAVITLIAKKVRSNDKNFFKTFTKSRGQLEQCLIQNKQLLGQAVVQIGSKQRVPRLMSMFENLIKEFSAGRTVSPDQLLAMLQLKGKLLASDLQSSNVSVSKETKSELFLKTSIDAAVTCPICHGLVDPKKSISYDHIKRVRDGGSGSLSNVQMTHPYCNSAVKN